MYLVEASFIIESMVLKHLRPHTWTWLSVLVMLCGSINANGDVEDVEYRRNLFLECRQTLRIAYHGFSFGIQADFLLVR